MYLYNTKDDVPAGDDDGELQLKSNRQWCVVASWTGLLTGDVHEVCVKSEDKRRVSSFEETEN